MSRFGIDGKVRWWMRALFAENGEGGADAPFPESEKSSGRCFRAGSEGLASGGGSDGPRATGPTMGCDGADGDDGFDGRRDGLALAAAPSGPNLLVDIGCVILSVDRLVTFGDSVFCEVTSSSSLLAYPTSPAILQLVLKLMGVAMAPMAKCSLVT